MSDASQKPDPAAVFGAALSLWHEYTKPSSSIERRNPENQQVSDDCLLSVIMSIATQFCAWAHEYAQLDNPNTLWPVFLKGQFGRACRGAIGSKDLSKFDERDCLRIALRLQIPLILRDGVPIPIDVTAANPNSDSPFRAFRIQTVRESLGEDTYEPFTWEDEPFDKNFKPPLFALYGVDAAYLLEHIADRQTYSEALSLAQKLAPGLQFGGDLVLAECG
jgi:hypothetical protein